MASSDLLRRKAAVVSRLSPGLPEPDEFDGDDAADAGDEAATGAASLLSIPIRRVKAQPASRRSTGDLIRFWEELRRGRRFPEPGDVDEKAAAARAPKGLLMSCSVNGRLVLVERVLSSSSPLGNRPDELLGAGAHAASVLEWLQTLGRTAAREGRPVEESEVFAGETGSVLYKGIVLPLSRDQSHVDQLICHLQMTPA